MPRMPKAASNKMPLYKQVEQYLSQQIQGGRWSHDTVLPSEWALAAEIGVSQGTVRKALSNLSTRGLVYRQQGVGTFISGINPEWGLFPLHDEYIHSRDIWPKQEILSILAVNTPPAVRQKLHLGAGEKVWQVQTLWRNGHQPVAYDEAWLPHALLPDLNHRQLSSRLGIYALLTQAYQLTPEPAATLLYGIHLDAETASRLKVAPHTAGIRCERTSHHRSQPIEWRRRLMVLEHIGLALPPG